MTREECIERLETIKAASIEENGYHLTIKMNDWQNYGKDRTYFKIAETREGSKHYSERDFGYYDNKAEAYIPGKNDLTENYSFSGSKF